MTDAPGPPPLPPAHFDERPIPVHTIPAGRTLFRIHPSGLGAAFYGPRTDPETRGRWDPPDTSFGVCYLAEAPHTAFAETFLRDLEREDVSERSDLAPRSLAMFRAERELRLARLHGPGMTRMRATAAVVQGPYSITCEWSRAFFNHPDRVDGISYRARHDDDGFGVALFDRSAALVRLQDSIPLLDLSLAAELASWLSMYEVGLSP